MKEVKIIDYTFAIAWHLKDNPEDSFTKNSMVFAFELDGQPVETIIRSLN
jgi:hypothetical protein